MKDDNKLTRREARHIYKQGGRKIVDASSNAFVSLRNINKIYPTGIQAVYNFNLDIDKHDFVALVGPSGCGKSTTLRMIAGLEEISDGKLYIDSVYSNFTPSKDRDIAMVFQSYALYPQLNVFDNIAFGLKIRKLDKKEIERRVFEAAAILDLGNYLDRKPKELSGGQMQRVALGRALVRHAKLFLMDEPLSNLDAKLRVQMRSEIVRIHEEADATTVYVTHDQTEAMTMANKIVVMNRGFVQQIGSPIDIYRHPANLFVATFIGTPPMNILEGTYKDGLISVPGLPDIRLPEVAIATHDHFMKTMVDSVRAKLELVDVLEIAQITSERLCLKAALNETQNTSHENVKPRKTNRLLKLVSKLRRRKEVKVTSADIRDLYRRELEEALSFYSSEGEEHAIKIGIRPENVYPATYPKDHVSKPFRLKSDLVEILGSEFIVYGRLPEKNITVKLQQPVATHEVNEYVIDIDKVHLFDETSGLCII